MVRVRWSHTIGKVFGRILCNAQAKLSCLQHYIKTRFNRNVSLVFFFVKKLKIKKIKNKIKLCQNLTQHYQNKKHLLKT
jgi:hypothetical protein